MDLVSLLINLIIWGLVLAIIWWGISQIPVPAPFSWVIRAVFALVCVLVLLSVLGVVGSGVSIRPIQLR